MNSGETLGCSQGCDGAQDYEGGHEVPEALLSQSLSQLSAGQIADRVEKRHYIPVR